MAKPRKINISEQTRDHLERIALSEEEYKLIASRLGREPNDLELGMFGALWSEHCGYKHSKLLLKKYFGSLPRPKWVIFGIEDGENAGVIDIDLALQGRCKACKCYIGREGLCEVCEKVTVLCPTCYSIPTLWNDPERRVLICDCGKTQEQL